MTSPNLHLDFFYFMQPHDNVLTCSHNLAGCNCLILSDLCNCFSEFCENFEDRCQMNP